MPVRDKLDRFLSPLDQATPVVRAPNRRQHLLLGVDELKKLRQF